MMNPMQILQAMQASQNPMQMMQARFGNDPLFGRAMQMTQGKSEEELKATVRNLARQRGMDDVALGQFLSQFGMRL